MITPIAIALIAYLGISWGRASFYRAYFFAKQRNAGRDPRKVLRDEFPLMWWLM